MKELTTPLRVSALWVIHILAACLPGYAPDGATLAVPDDPPLSAGAGSTGAADVGVVATGTSVAPLLPPTAGASDAGVGATPPLPPDGADGVDALTGLPLPLPGWGVVVVDWGAAIGAGVGDGPPVGCCDDDSGSPTACVVPAVAQQGVDQVAAGDDVSRMLTWRPPMKPAGAGSSANTGAHAG